MPFEMSGKRGPICPCVRCIKHFAVDRNKIGVIGLRIPGPVTGGTYRSASFRPDRFRFYVAINAFQSYLAGNCCYVLVATPPSWRQTIGRSDSQVVIIESISILLPSHHSTLIYNSSRFMHGHENFWWWEWIRPFSASGSDDIFEESMKKVDRMIGGEDWCGWSC